MLRKEGSKMYLVTAEEMRLIDQKAINEYGIPGVVLMENAGLAVVDVIKDHFSGHMAKRSINDSCSTLPVTC